MYSLICKGTGRFKSKLTIYTIYTYLYDYVIYIVDLIPIFDKCAYNAKMKLGR